ncbi:toll/interleukin-1 receptor domain-containing protein [Actinokineospora sp. NPDC004072]
MERTVFINYRGTDSHSYGALLYHHLVGRFGEDLVFLDCQSIPAGADFVVELLGRVRSARVLLAVIGPQWLTATDPATGRRRIDNPHDWIRRELREAFAAGVTVIPVLTEQIAIPAEGDLPGDIAMVSRCQYRRLRHHDSTADLARRWRCRPGPRSAARRRWWGCRGRGRARPGSGRTS